MYNNKYFKNIKYPWLLENANFKMVLKFHITPVKNAVIRVGRRDKYLSWMLDVDSKDHIILLFFNSIWAERSIDYLTKSQYQV